MKKILLLSPLLLLLFGAGCQTSSINPYRSETQGVKIIDCSNLEPENPYSEGSGHYAGFEWAERKEPSYCTGNSNSFIEGCEEYQSQAEDYENCLNR